MLRRFGSVLLLSVVGSTFLALSQPALSTESFFQKKSANPVKTASAESTRRKPNFFEFLFGNQRSRQNRDSIDLIYGDEPGMSRRGQDDFVDPEPLPSIGMGNLTYRPPAQLPVYDSANGKLTAATAQGEIIRDILSDRNSKILADVASRKAVLEFYKARQFAPVWVENGKLSERAFSVMIAMAHAGDDGLQPVTYLPLGINSYETATSDANDLEEHGLLNLDISLTVEALKFAQHLYSGQFDPNLLSQYNDINVEKLDPAFALKIIAWSPYPDAYFKTLVPSHPNYSLLKSALAKLQQGNGDAAVDLFPEGPLVKPGKSDVRIPELRRRMQELGLLDPADAIVAEADREILDKPLSAAVRLFQQQNKLKPTGSLNPQLVAALNIDPTTEHRNKLIANMERLRWLTRNLGDRYVLVNQAAFSAEVIDNGQSIWRTRVIVGKPLTQTPSFDDEFETVVFNPSWGLPQSIIINEYLGKLRRDPGYFDKIGYRVTNSMGQVVSSYDVDWYSVGPNSGIGVQQPPGDDNALGELKFLFPNKHDVYMHDTPTRNLFTKDMRAFSHGCVRVQDPRRFAEILLGWDGEKVAEGIQAGESFSVPIKRKTKVHLTYFTAWPDQSGTLQYYPDFYERDKAMIEALESSDKARKQLISQRVADAAVISTPLKTP